MAFIFFGQALEPISKSPEEDHDGGELLRFYLAYAGRGSLAAADKRRWRWIARRVRRLERRRPKYEAIWDRPGVRPRNV